MATSQLLCAIAGVFLMFVFPEALEYIIDEVIPSGDLKKLAWIVGLAGAAYFFRELFEMLRIQLNNTFEQKVIYDIRSDLYDKVQRLPVNWFDSRPTGDLMTRVSEDVTNMERILIDGVEQGLVAVLQIIGVAFFLFVKKDAGLAGVAMIPIPFLFLGACWYTRGARVRSRRVRSASGEMNALLVDNISGVRQIKAYAVESDEHARFNRASNKVQCATLDVMRMWSLYRPGMSFFAHMGRILVLGFGGYVVVSGDMKIGELTSFLFYLGLFYDPIDRLHHLNQMAQSSRAAAERVFEIMDTEDEPGIGVGEELKEVKGHIRYEGVSFSYDGGKAPAIHSIDLEAAAGDTIALVGTTGAGKSTLINLLTRFYEYDAGVIRLDGKPIHEIEKRSLRSAMGYVTQESFLFNGTVRENLEIGRRDATDEQCWEALRSANAADFVGRLEAGLDAQVGERGVRLSVGEKQRLSIARAILRDPPILILDEATASVDSETERLIQSALDKLMKARTSFVIAHRLSTVRNADRIYVIERGRVLEQGTHESLIELGGAYAKLCQTSFLDDKG